VLAIDWNWLSLAVEMNGTSGAATSELALTCGSQTTTRMVACASASYFIVIPGRRRHSFRVVKLLAEFSTAPLWWFRSIIDRHCPRRMHMKARVPSLHFIIIGTELFIKILMVFLMLGSLSNYKPKSVSTDAPRGLDLNFILIQIQSSKICTWYFNFFYLQCFWIAHAKDVSLVRHAHSKDVSLVRHQRFARYGLSMVHRFKICLQLLMG
jgi:hypothetical protein